MKKNSQKPTYRPGGPYYYASWASYIKPFRPIEELSEAEAHANALAGKSYYEAYFDEEGRITQFTKFLRGDMLFVEKYRYAPDGRSVECEMFDANGVAKGFATITL